MITELDTNPVALSVCQLFCGQAGTLWPKPTGHLSIGNTVVPVNPENIVLAGIPAQTVVGNLLQRNVDRLKEGAKRLGGSAVPNAGGTKLVIRLNEGLDLDDAKLTLNTNESYVLDVAMVNGQVSYGKKRACWINLFWILIKLLPDVFVDCPTVIYAVSHLDLKNKTVCVSYTKIE